MHRRWTTLLALGLITLSAPVSAGDLQEITLTDGSALYGEVVSLEKGIYTIRSGTLGTVKIDADKVRMIRSLSARKPERRAAAPEAPPAAPRPEAAGGIGEIQRMLMADEEVMGMIEALADDPEIRKLLADPAVAEALRSGDVAALLANPEFMSILGHPGVREIQKEALKK